MIGRVTCLTLMITLLITTCASATAIDVESMSRDELLSLKRVVDSRVAELNNHELKENPIIEFIDIAIRDLYEETAQIDIKMRNSSEDLVITGVDFSISFIDLFGDSTSSLNNKATFETMQPGEEKTFTYGWRPNNLEEIKEISIVLRKFMTADDNIYSERIGPYTLPLRQD